MIRLSDTQYFTLKSLAKGERPRLVSAQTRRWLRNAGYITVTREKNSFLLEITDLGREVIKDAVKVSPTIPGGLL